MPGVKWPRCSPRRCEQTKSGRRASAEVSMRAQAPYRHQGDFFSKPKVFTNEKEAFSCPTLP